jgi:hypothetical protein
MPKTRKHTNTGPIIKSLSLKFSSMHVEWCEEYEQRLAVANDIREVSDES